MRVNPRSLSRPPLLSIFLFFSPFHAVDYVSGVAVPRTRNREANVERHAEYLTRPDRANKLRVHVKKKFDEKGGAYRGSSAMLIDSRSKREHEARSTAYQYFITKLQSLHIYIFTH